MLSALGCLRAETSREPGPCWQNTIIMHTLQQIAAELSRIPEATIVTHVSPDIDALASAAALSSALARLGIKTQFYHPEAVPERFRPLLAGIKMQQELPPPLPEIVISVDAATKQRVAGADSGLFSQTRTLFNIDHHISNAGFGDWNYIDPAAASSTVIVTELLNELKLQPDAYEAQLLLAGLVDDTGCFRYSNTDSRSFTCAAALVQAGARPEDIANLLYFSLPARMVILHGLAMSRLEFVAGGQAALAYVNKEMLEQFQAGAEDTEGLVDWVRSTAGIKVAVFMREIKEGWKFSLRSKTPEVNVNEICSCFGGGGHSAAAGCRIPGSFDEAKAKMLAKLEEVLG